MAHAHWRDEYVARDEILRNLQKWIEQGLSDADIAGRWGTFPELIWRLRTRYHFFRPGECPDCGCREFKEGLECPNVHCITVWPRLWREGEKRREEEEKRDRRGR